MVSRAAADRVRCDRAPQVARRRSHSRCRLRLRRNAREAAALRRGDGGRRESERDRVRARARSGIGPDRQCRAAAVCRRRVRSLGLPGRSGTRFPTTGGRLPAAPRSAPGGFLIATVPAYPALWSSHDEAAGHLRRYAAGDSSPGPRAKAGEQSAKRASTCFCFRWRPARAGWRGSGKRGRVRICCGRRAGWARCSSCPSRPRRRRFAAASDSELGCLCSPCSKTPKGRAESGVARSIRAAAFLHRAGVRAGGGGGRHRRDHRRLGGCG